MLDNSWDESIRVALGRSRASTVFVESRADLTAEIASGGCAEVRQSAWSGAGIELEGGDYVYHAGVDPEQLPDLASGRPPAAFPGRKLRPAEHGILDPRWAVGAVTGLVVEAGRRVPQAAFRARWVESAQAVKIGAGHGVFDDRRETRRIRLEGMLHRDGRTSWAATERVLEADVPVSELIEATASRLEARLGASVPPSSDVAVVFAPGVAGIWVHELVGHAAEADTVARGSSWMTRPGPPLARELSVIDDPRRARAAWKVDDEGTPCRPVALIQEGRPREFLHTLATAAQMGVEPTGHARRGSFRERSIPRMGCTFIANGRDDPQSILKNVQCGIYVRRIETANTDAATGRALFRVADADVIRNGNLGEALEPHLLETQAREALAGIDGIGDDLAFDRCIGSCHRDGQTLTTSVGAPTICTRLMKVRF